MDFSLVEDGVAVAAAAAAAAGEQA